MSLREITSMVARWPGIRILAHSSLSRNWGSLIFCGLGSQALGMLATIRIARVLRPEGFGEYNLVLAIAGVAFILSSLGLRQVIIRECARDADKCKTILQRVLVIRGSLALVVAIGVLFYSRLVPGNPSLVLDLCVVVLLVGQLVWDSIESVMFGVQQMVTPAIINLLGSMIWVCLIWSMPLPLLTSFSVALCFALLQVVKAMTLLTFWFRTYIRATRPGTIGPVTVMHLLSNGLPFYWLAIMTAAGTSIPVLFLSLRSTSAEIGLFNAPLRILSPLQLLLNSGIAVLYPLLSNQSLSDHIGFTHSVKKAAIMIAAGGSCLALCVSLLRREVVLLLFGPAYEACADVLMYQCWFTLFLAAYSLIGTVLSARDRQHALATLSTVYAIATMPFIWFGSEHGALGLAIGMLIGSIINFFYHWIVFQRSMPIPFPARESIYLLSFACILAAPAWTIPSQMWWPVRSAVIVLAICITSLVIIRAMNLTLSEKPGTLVKVQQG